MLRIYRIGLLLILSFLSFTACAAALKDPVGGNPNGKVTVIEFFDYQCSHCVSMTPTVDAIVKANPDVRVVYKEFPIRGDLSMEAARAALAASIQGKYVAFHQALMNNAATLNSAKLYSLAQQLGLDVNKLKQDMNSAAVTNQLRSNYDLAEKMGINVTPVFLVGKTGTDPFTMKLILGEVSQSELQQEISNAKK